MSERDEYEVGYRRPPQDTRWQKGQSGNPKGRPKREISLVAHHLLKALEMPVTIHDENGDRVVTAREAIVRLRMQAGAKGDPHAFEDLLKLEKREVPPRHKAEFDGFIVEYVSATDPAPASNQDANLPSSKNENEGP